MAKTAKEQRSTKSKIFIPIINFSVLELVMPYLKHWEACRKDETTGWKFQKLKQSWLLKHYFDDQYVLKKDLKVLLKYLGPLQGNAKKRLYDQATDLYHAKKRQKKILKKGASLPESELEVTKNQYKRAKKIIKLWAADY